MMTFLLKLTFLLNICRNIFKQACSVYVYARFLGMFSWWNITPSLTTQISKLGLLKLCCKISFEYTTRGVSR